MSMMLTAAVIGLWAQYCVIVAVKHTTEPFMKFSLAVAVVGSFLAVGTLIWAPSV